MPTADDQPEVPGARESLTDDLELMDIRANSRDAAIRVLQRRGFSVVTAALVYDAIFDLGFAAGKLEGHREDE